MRDAAVERLSKLISEGSASDDSNDGADLQGRRPFELHLSLSEGWFSLFLLAAVVYTAIWSVQAAGWVEHISILTFTTALGLISGVFAAKQQRVPGLLVHVAVLVFGLLLAFWQTAGAFYNGDLGAFAHALNRWFGIAIGDGTGDDNAIFLFFIVALAFILAYTSAWLVYRMRNPWLMILANAVVLLINLSYVDPGYIIFLAVFLLASLLLVLRLNLYASIQHWERMGLRYADDLNWDVMQAGLLISIGILVLSWLLPFGYLNPAAAQVWNVSSNPWVQLQNTWNRVISIDGGATPANHGNFRDTLALGGNPNLNTDVVFKVQTNDDSAQYLAIVSYDSYHNRNWSISATDQGKIPANTPPLSGSALTHQVKQKITVVNPPYEQYPYITGAPEIAAISRSAKIITGSGGIVAWLSDTGNFTAGSNYTVTSTVSSADINTLRTVPLPKDAPTYYINPNMPDIEPPVNAFAPTVVHDFTQTGNIDPRIKSLAQQIVHDAKATTMYDMAAALEKYLHDHYRYNTAVNPPAGQDPVSWFLFESHESYCTYFASAMTLMARSLGMPSRVVAGYTAGKYDAAHHEYVIRGNDAHSWPQVYFAGYGWINFQPSAGYTVFTRPAPNQYPSTAASTAASNVSSSLLNKLHNGRLANEPGDANGSHGANALDAQLQLRQTIGTATGSLVLLVLFSAMLFALWWRRLFRRYSLASQVYGRICVLAAWAGLQPRPSQTPNEYLDTLAITALPAATEAGVLERLGDIYVRERWADPESKEHPRRSGEMAELPGLWQRLRPRLFLYVLRHPYFLRRLPARWWQLLVSFWRHLPARRFLDGEF